MQDFLQDLNQYCAEHSTHHEAGLLEEIERATHLRTLAPRMLSGALQGSFLSMMSRLLSPRKILEIGTFTGYSAICLAQGLPSDGMLYTIEYDEEIALMASEYLQRSSRSAQISLMVGDAKKKIPELDEIFDLVLIDADKEAYGQYLNLVTPLTRPGSLVLVDNVLWNGRVLEDNMDKKTRVMDQFNKSVCNNPHWEVMILPVRDGISILRRI